MALASFEIRGDMLKFERFLSGPKFSKNLEREIRKATIKNSLLAIRAIGKKIRAKDFQENQPLTLALARNTIPLLKEKNMLDALSFQLRNSFVSEVGFIKNAQSTGGVTGATIEMKKLVELMESGYVIKVTPKMIAAMMAALNSRRTKKGNLTGRARKALRAIDSTRGGGGIKNFRVAPRPFMTQVFQELILIREIKANWNEALERVWEKQGALGGEHRNKGKPGADR